MDNPRAGSGEAGKQPIIRKSTFIFRFLWSPVLLQLLEQYRLVIQSWRDYCQAARFEPQDTRAPPSQRHIVRNDDGGEVMVAVEILDEVEDDA